MINVIDVGLCIMEEDSDLKVRMTHPSSQTRKDDVRCALERGLCIPNKGHQKILERSHV